jgi:CHAD domain-containing protein
VSTREKGRETDSRNLLRQPASGREGVRLAQGLFLSEKSRLLSLVKTFPRLSLQERIHRVRTVSKRLRAYLQLLRPSLPKGKYRRTNQRLAALARTFSSEREAGVLKKTMQKLLPRLAGGYRSYLAGPGLRRVTQVAGKNSRSAKPLPEKLRAAEKVLAAMVEGILGESGLESLGADALVQGVVATYRRACKRMRQAKKTGQAERFHAWRKFVKYLYYQLDLLCRRGGPPALAGFRAQLRRLEQDLGQMHDYVVLAERASNLPTESCQKLSGEAQSAAKALAKKTLTRGRILFDRSPDRFESFLWQNLEAYA